MFVHIPLFVGVAVPVPADVGPEPPVPASLAAPHALAIDYEGPIASVATFGVSVDVAGLTIGRSENESNVDEEQKGNVQEIFHLKVSNFCLLYDILYFVLMRAM